VGWGEIAGLAAASFAGYSFAGGAAAAWFLRWRRSLCSQCPPLGPNNEDHQQEHIAWAVGVGLTWPASFPAIVGVRAASLPSARESRQHKIELTARRRAAEVQRLERELGL
jgi:hypothetical protein